MDGVLIEAKEWHYDALNRALAVFGHCISRYDHLVSYDGLPTRVKLEMLSKERNLPKGLHDFINKLKQEYTFEIIHQKCKPLFRHQYALAELKRHGYKLAVCSNSIKNTIELMMQKSDLKSYLDIIISNEDVSNPKPNPEIYLRAMTLLNLNPTECLILEDNKNGIEAALMSGGHLLKIDNVNEVNYENIHLRINEIERM